MVRSETEQYASFARRLYGLALRHLYLYQGSWPRLIEMMYWPIINISLFGFVSLSFVQRLGHAEVVTDAYLGGLLLSEIVSRTTMAMIIMYLEEVWSKNLGHLFASPLKMKDYVLSLIGLGTLRCAIAVIPAYLFANFLFHFSILRFGPNLIAYVGLLFINGWWEGLLILSLLLKYGLAAEWLGWMCTWLLLPFMAPYYPISVLPSALQTISYSLPGTYVFESMKIQVAMGVADTGRLWTALILNVAYLAASMAIFNVAYRSTKKAGGLLQVGE